MYHFIKLKFVQRLVCLLVPAILPGIICSEMFGSENDFTMPFLRLENEMLIADHGLPFVFEIPKEWNIIEPFSYRESYHGVRFCVTVCAFWKDETIVAVHAERLEDESGSLDYSYMEPAVLSDLNFYKQDRVAVLDPGAVEKAKDLKYFKSRGFDFSPSIHLRQYFYHSKDGNAEYVVTIGKKTGDKLEGNFRVASDLDQLAAQLFLTLNL